MVLPLFAAFVKGAAEAGEDMIDFKAKNDAEKAKLAQKYNLDFQNKKRIEAYKKSVKDADQSRMVGPYGYTSNLSVGSMEDIRQRAAQFESGIAGDPQKYALWQKENPTLVSPLRRSLRAAFARIKDRDTKTIKLSDGSERIVSKSMQNAFPKTWNALNLNEPVPPALANSTASRVEVVEPGGSSQTVTPPNAEGPRVLTGPVIRSGAFITEFAQSNAAFKNNPNFTFEEIMQGANALKRNFENNAQKGDVRSRQLIRSLSTTNPFVSDLIMPIRFTRNNEQVTLFPGDILGGGELDVDGREKLAERLLARVATQPLDKQIAQTKLVTRAFKALNYVDVERDEPIQRTIGSAYEAVSDISPGAAKKYKARHDKRSPQAKQWLEKVRTGQANEKLVNMLGIMEKLSAEGGGRIGGNVFQRIRGNLGGVALSLIEMIDTNKFENGAAAAKAKDEFKNIFESGTEISNQKLFESMQQFVAFALAQIVQTGADKISNADVDNMKEGLGGMLADTRSQLRLIRKLRSEAMKNLLAHGGYLTVMGGTTELPEDYGDFISAQEQYTFFKDSSVAFSNALAFKHWGRRARGLTVNEEGISYSTQTPFIQSNPVFSTESLGGKALSIAVNEAIFQSADNYQEGEDDAPAPYYVQAVKAMRGAEGDAEVREAQEKYQRFKYNLGDQRDHVAVMKLVKQNLPQNTVSHHTVHVADYGFIPFVRVREGGVTVLKRLEVNGVSVFAGARELKEQLDKEQSSITMKAEGGLVSITDRLKAMQNTALQEQ